MNDAAGLSGRTQVDPIKHLLKLADYCKNEGKCGTVKNVYKLMLNTKMFEIAYQKLKSNPGNMTPGIVPTTLDGMSAEVLTSIIKSLRNQSFQFTPGRRIQIPKPSGGERPITIAPPRDKLVQEVMRMILEVIFEPTFHDTSFGFRPGIGCHGALKEIKQKFGVAK